MNRTTPYSGQDSKLYPACGRPCDLEFESSTADFVSGVDPTRTQLGALKSQDVLQETGKSAGDCGSQRSILGEEFENVVTSATDCVTPNVSEYGSNKERGAICGARSITAPTSCNSIQNGNRNQKSPMANMNEFEKNQDRIVCGDECKTSYTDEKNCNSISPNQPGLENGEKMYVSSITGNVPQPEEQIGPPVNVSCMDEISVTQSTCINFDTRNTTSEKVEIISAAGKHCGSTTSHTVDTDVQPLETPPEKDTCPKQFIRCSLRYKSKCRTYKWIGIAVFYLSAVLCVVVYRNITGQNEGAEHDHTGHQRIKRSAGASNGSQVCDPDAGKDQIYIMSYEVFQNGGWLVHVLIGLYTFSAIAAICDIYFVPALEHICDRLKLDADVAGATFMAAASSAPEFCTSVIGIFIQKNDVGLGAIVGSSIFNLLAIVGLCAIFAGMPVELSWYPLTRDSIFYTVAVFEMLAFMYDQTINWYESTLMIATYGIYILVMVYNKKIEQMANGPEPSKASDLRESSSHDEVKKLSDSGKKEEVGSHAQDHSTTSARIEIIKRRSHSRTSASIRMSATRLKQLHSITAENTSTNIHTVEHSSHASKTSHEKVSFIGEPVTGNGSPYGIDTEVDPPPTVKKKVSTTIEHFSEVAVEEEPPPPESPPEEENTIAEYENPLNFPETKLGRAYWIAVLPITLLHVYTIPDSRIRDSWQSRYYMIPFIMSVVYLAIYSYIMVWAISLAAWALHVPSTVTGLTVLAAGTSVPDCLSSIFVARDGLGDMAVSNAIGSNVFDILLCLGVPWLLNSLTSGSGHHIEGEGMWVAGCTLAVTIIYLTVSLKLANWTLTPLYGLLTLAFYAVIITFCILVEMNLIWVIHAEERCDNGFSGH